MAEFPKDWRIRADAIEGKFYIDGQGEGQDSIYAQDVSVGAVHRISSNREMKVSLHPLTTGPFVGRVRYYGRVGGKVVSEEHDLEPGMGRMSKNGKAVFYGK